MYGSSFGLMRSDSDKERHLKVSKLHFRVGIFVDAVFLAFHRYAELGSQTCPRLRMKCQRDSSDETRSDLPLGPTIKRPIDGRKADSAFDAYAFALEPTEGIEVALVAALFSGSVLQSRSGTGEIRPRHCRCHR